MRMRGWKDGGGRIMLEGWLGGRGVVFVHEELFMGVGFWEGEETRLVGMKEVDIGGMKV